MLWKKHSDIINNKQTIKCVYTLVYMNAKLHECILTCRGHQGIQFFPKREKAAMTNIDMWSQFN